MTDIATLRDEVDRLNKEKLVMEEKLKDLTARRIGNSASSHGNSNKRKRPLPIDHARGEQRSSVKPRVMSTVAAVIHHDDDLSPTAPKTVPDNDASKPVPREVNSNPDTVKRNRRMFGALMGHLGKARQSLEVDSFIIEKQATAKSTAMEKHFAESKRLIQQQRILSQHEKNKELNLRDELAAKRQKAQLAKEAIAFKEEQNKLLEYILTDTVPQLSWRPSRLNAITEQLLEARKSVVAKLLEDRDRADAEKREQIDAEVLVKRNKRLADEASLDTATGNVPCEDAITDNRPAGAFEMNDDDREDEDEGDRILAALEGNRSNEVDV